MAQLSLLQNEGGVSPLIPEVGLYTDISSKDYHAVNAVSSSRLKLLKKSPAHLRYELDNPSPQTDAMRLGEALHTAILEPDLFASNYAVAPKVDGRTKEGKQAKAEFELANGHKTIIDMEDYATCLAMHDSVRTHSKAWALIQRAEMKEVSGFFNDPLTGLFCKMRADAVCSSIGTMFDLKSTKDASRYEFERAIFQYGYHRQGAHYIDGMAVLGIKVDHYAIIAIEKTAPFCVAVYRLQNDVIELGRKENIQLMDIWKKCQDSGDWSGYPDHITDIAIPAWAKNQTERELYEF